MVTRPLSRRRVLTVVRRHLIVLWRSPQRWFDIVVWPLFDVLLWGSLGAFVAQQDETSRATTPYLLAGIMLFHVLFQSQIAVATGFMEETWSRNLLNLMTTPLTEGEYAAGLALYAGLKTVLAMAAVSLTAFGFFGFGLGEVGWTLVPVIGILLLVGWAVALFNIGLMLRFGQSAEIFTWGTNFLLLSVSGVFNPVSALPTVVQPLARVLPTTHAFGAARGVLDGDALSWSTLAWGYLGAAVLIALGYWFIAWMLATFRQKGYVTRFSRDATSKTPIIASYGPRIRGP
jgi:ABC-2 type transport system permease protein